MDNKNTFDIGDIYNNAEQLKNVDAKKFLSDKISEANEIYETELGLTNILFNSELKMVDEYFENNLYKNLKDECEVNMKETEIEKDLQEVQSINSINESKDDSEYIINNDTSECIVEDEKDEIDEIDEIEDDDTTLTSEFSDDESIEEKELNNEHENLETELDSVDEISSNEDDNLESSELIIADDISEVSNTDTHEPEEKSLINSIKSIFTNKKDDNQGEEDSILSYVKIILVALLIALFVNNFILSNTKIPSASMEPTVMTGDRLFGNRLAYEFGEDPKRGDIIIFKYPDNPSERYIKRIIGEPGDTIQICDDVLYVNSKVLDESEYLTVTPKGTYGPYVVPEDSYFVLGDNRNDSKDSRFWKNTFVKKDAIIAKAMFKYYPSFEWIE